MRFIAVIYYLAIKNKALSIIINSNLMMQFGSLLTNITEFVHEISVACYNSRFETPQKRELSFAKAMVGVLNSHEKILPLLSKIPRSDLADSIKIHSIKYLKEYAKYPELKTEACLFENCVQEVLKKISGANKYHVELANKEIEFLSDRFYKIIKKVKALISNQLQNKEVIEYIHAASIVYRIENISLDKQDALIDLLMMVKELWDAEYKTEKSTGLSIAEKFYARPNDYLKINDQFNAKTIFAIIVNLLTDSHNSILTYLQDGQILNLYDRLKNYQGSNAIQNLLFKLHWEAQFRYSYNKLSEVGYQLLNRFQSFDAITHKIENLEFHVLEAYLFKRNHFAKEILVNIAKHSDNIKALGLSKNEDLQKIISFINKLLQANSSDNESGNAMLIAFRENLGKMVHSHIKRRYADLDKFTIAVLQDKYQNLFANIVPLFTDKSDAKKFLHNTLTCRLAADYYLPSLSNSISKLRVLAKERKKVLEMLAQIDFIAIFGPRSFNKITSFNFRKKYDTAEVRTSTQYVKSVIDDIALHANAFQLDILYKLVTVGNKPVPSKEVKSMLIEAVKAQINQRATIRNMLYSIISGNKKEYDKLKSLEKLSTKEEMV